MEPANLGKCLAEYKTSAAGFAKVVAIMFGSLGVATMLFALAINGGPHDVGGRVVCAFLGSLFLVPALLCVYGLTRGRNNALRFHERGITIHKAGHDTAILWDDVASYTDGSFLTIETNDEVAIDFGLDGLGARDEILATVREEVVVRRAVPRLRKAIREGTPAEFNGATLDARGITLTDSSRKLPWEDVIECGSITTFPRAGKYTTQTTTVFFKSATERLELVDNEASDRDALVALCNEMISASPGRQASR